MHVRRAECADITFPWGVEGRAVDLKAAEWIGAVEDDHLHVVLETGCHAVEHAAHVSVAAGADVLQVDHEGIEPLEHFGGGATVFVVEGINR